MSEELVCGKILNEPNAIYHSRDAVTSTRLRTFIGSPLKYHRTYIAKTLPQKSTYALDVGQAFHALMESEAAFAALTVSSPYKNFRTDEAKAWRDEITKNHIILDADERAALHAMKANVLAHPEASILLANTEAEVTFRAKLGRFYVQCRADRWNGAGCELTDGLPYFVDFKKVDSLDDLESDASNYDYHIQQIYYQEVIATVLGYERTQPRPRAFLVVSEFKPPHEVQVFEWDEFGAQVAKAAVLKGIRDMRQAYATDTWPGRPTGIRKLSLKYWKIKESAAALEGDVKPQLTA